MDTGATGELIALINRWIEPQQWIHPRHEVRDEAHLGDLVMSLRDYGWQGPPIVVWGDVAFTGSHRLAAIAMLRTEGVEIEIPTVDIANVCRVCDVDWDAHCQEWGHLTYDRDRMIAEKLPAEVVEYLSLDLH
jgi:hypothetical protein